MKNNITVITSEHISAISFDRAKKIAWHIAVTACLMFCFYSTGLYAETGVHDETQLGVESDKQPTTHNIFISEHEFEDWSFIAHPDDIIEITNRAKISHSIYIISADGGIITIDPKVYVQTPGTTIKWKVPASGEYTLKCWIHPSINSTLLVTE